MHTQRESRDEPLDRRRFLQSAGAGALAAAGAGLWGRCLPAEDEKGEKKAPRKGERAEALGPYAPFRMAIQSYSLRKFDFEKMVQHLYDLEMHFVELYPGHMKSDLGEFEFRSHMRIMRQNSVRALAYGVVEFTKDAEKNRALFDFAKKVRLASLTGNPSPDSFDSLDKLVEEYKIPVGIHNHGPEDKLYRTPELIEKAIKDHHKLIGLCVDTGHFLRAGVDPVEVVKQFKDRVYGCHLKDVKSTGEKRVFSVLGQGDLKLVDLLKLLKEAGFKGGLSLEYEEEEDNPIASIKKCLEAVREAVKKIA
jgi:inosose dehydratase